MILQLLKLETIILLKIQTGNCYFSVKEFKIFHLSLVYLCYKVYVSIKKYLCEAFQNRSLAGPLQVSDVGESTVVEEVPAHLQCPSWF